MSHHAKQYSTQINLRQNNSKSCGDILCLSANTMICQKLNWLVHFFP
jgi:hypothetical protein